MGISHLCSSSAGAAALTRDVGCPENLDVFPAPGQISFCLCLTFCYYCFYPSPSQTGTWGQKGIGIQHVFLYVLITPPAKVVSPTLIAVGTAVVKNASEISVRVVNPVHLEHLRVLVYAVHLFSVYMGQNHDAH